MEEGRWQEARVGRKKEERRGAQETVQRDSSDGVDGYSMVLRIKEMSKITTQLDF